MNSYYFSKKYTVFLFSMLIFSVHNQALTYGNYAMNDTKTTLEELKKVAAQFLKDRDWEQFHNPKNDSTDIAIEAAELIEFFVWIQGEEVYQVLEKKREQIEDETADILFALLNFCNVAKIDLAKAFIRKMQKNAEKYPVEKARGKYTKYSEL